jgi:hypothetical protein
VYLQIANNLANVIIPTCGVPIESGNSFQRKLETDSIETGQESWSEAMLSFCLYLFICIHVKFGLALFLENLEKGDILTSHFPRKRSYEVVYIMVKEAAEVLVRKSVTHSLTDLDNLLSIQRL